MNIKLLGLLLVSALAMAAPSQAGAPLILAQPVAVGTMKATTIHAQTGSMILESIKIKPGGNFGWHTHGTPVAVVVTRGTLTVFDPAVGACAPFEVSKGRSFVGRYSRSTAPNTRCERRDAAARRRSSRVSGG